MNATLEAMMANFNSYKTGKTMKEAKTQRAKAQVDRMDGSCSQNGSDREPD